MKKLLTVIAVLALLFPVSAMAGMTAITDSEMADVTGQVGIDIAVVDFAMDFSIANICWGDGDSGTVVASGHLVPYGPGYLNLGELDMYIYVTMNGTPIFTDTVGSYFIAAQPLGIDILTAGSYADGNAYEATWDTTGILISIPDMYITIDDMSLAGIYLTPECGSVSSVYDAVHEKYIYTLSNDVTPCQSLGSLRIEGIEVITYSSVPGTTVFAGTTFKSAYQPLPVAGPASQRWYPDNKALVIISPHCETPAELYPGQ
jgi:hypothetical protein